MTHSRFWLKLAWCLFAAITFVKHSMTRTPAVPVETNPRTQAKPSLDATPPAEAGSSNNNNNNLGVQLQLSHKTFMNRYPEEYNATARYFATQQQKQLKLLSFGCSTGEEAVTLAKLYFPQPEVTIVGVDIDDKTLVRAQELVALHHQTDKITILNGQRTPAADYGPYDAVYANSVLCRHPAYKVEDVTDHFGWTQFEEMVQNIDALVRVGGLLAITNSNYDLMESPSVAYKYTVIAKCPGQFVPRVNRASHTLIKVGGRPMDCVYLKKQA